MDRYNIKKTEAELQAQMKNEPTPDPKIDQQKVEMYIFSNREYFPSSKLVYLKSQLAKVDDRKFDLISTINLKSPQIITLVSLFLGIFGVDRFMVGNIAIGILKLLTGGLCGILWLYDFFTISERVKKRNFENIMIIL